MEETPDSIVKIELISILLMRKGLKFLSDSVECNHPSRLTLEAYCIPKVVRMETWRSHVRESKHVTSASTKNLLETRMEEKIGFRTCSTIRSLPTIKEFPSNQSIPNPDHDENRTTRCLPWRKSRARCKKNDPFSWDQNAFPWTSCQTWKDRATRC